MLPEIDKISKWINEFLRLIGLSIGPRFAPVAASTTITVVIACFGLTLVRDLESRIGIIEKANLSALNGEIVKRIDHLTEKIGNISDRQEKSDDFINRIASKINGTADGFWIPVSMNLEDRASFISLKLPILGEDRVEMAIYYEDFDRVRVNIIQNRLLLEINGKVLSVIKQYMTTDVPVLVDREYILEEKEYQQIRISLDNKLSEQEFNEIRGRQVGLLVVVRRAVTVDREQENVPAIGSSS